MSQVSARWIVTGSGPEDAAWHGSGSVLRIPGEMRGEGCLGSFMLLRVVEGQ